MKPYERDNFLLDANTCKLVREYMPEAETLISLADFFSALCDKTRLKILSALAISPMCVNDLAGLLGLNQTTVSHQLKILRQTDLVKYKKSGKNVYYTLADDHVKSIIEMALAHINEKE